MLNFLLTIVMGFAILFGVSGSVFIGWYLTHYYQNETAVVTLLTCVLCLSYLVGKFARSIVAFFKGK